MTRDEEHRTLIMLETIGGELANVRSEQRTAAHALGRLEGTLSGQDKILQSIAGDCTVNREAWQVQGRTLAEMAPRCAQHERRISELVHRIGASEITGTIQIAEASWRRRVLASAGRIALGVFSAVGVAASVAALFAKLNR